MQARGNRCVRVVGMMFLLLASAFLVVGCGGNGKTGVPGGGGQPGTGTRTISGRVTNAANPTQGIRNAAVKLFPSKLKLVEDRSRQTPIAQTTTDQNGNFALTAIMTASIC